MNRTLFTLAAVAAILSFTDEASAEDFTGVRIEATAGWDQIRFDLADFGVENEKEAALSWGFAAGYDAALGQNLIAGVQAGVSFSGIDLQLSSAGRDTELRAGRTFDLSGRLGARIGSNGLIFGRLGYSNLRVRADSTTADATSSDANNLDGVLFGAGAEVALSPVVYLTSEFRHSNYQDGLSRNQLLTGVGLRF